jgi:hypothetical protein
VDPQFARLGHAALRLDPAIMIPLLGQRSDTTAELIVLLLLVAFALACNLGSQQHVSTALVSGGQFLTSLTNRFRNFHGTLDKQLE